MPEITESEMKRIFYFNITYGCNSNCIFCYSHNTRHSGEPYNEMPVGQFFEYLNGNALSADDRVIINGGEPFVHTDIEKLLGGLIPYGCEVLVYTNGRLAADFDLSRLNGNFRFVIPVHGYEEIHDRITGVKGSYGETLRGLKALVENTDCPVDVKLIVNHKLVSEDSDGARTIQAFENGILFNHAIHLTKMADTVVSQRNGCRTVTNGEASRLTRIFFDYFRKRQIKIKIFDNCIKSMEWMKDCRPEKYRDGIEVYFKDRNQYRVLSPAGKAPDCRKECPFADNCISAVDTYKVLEFFDNKLYENLE